MADPFGPFKNPLRLGFYDVDRTIGQGNFAIVKLAKHRITKTQVAIKIIHKNKLDEGNLSQVYREMEILKLLNHPHIIKLYQIMETKSSIYIVSEYAANGEIFEYISRHGKLSEENARDKFSQILDAVDYCHSHHVIHRDLKAENLLLDEENNIKVADFGFSNFIKPNELLSTWCGSPPYAAPEVFEGKTYKGPEIDVWSLGVVLYVLVCGTLPFTGSNLSLLKDRVLSCRFRIPFFLSSECESLIRKMLVRDPQKRISLSGVSNHPWMKRQTNSGLLTKLDFKKKPVNHQILRVMHNLGIDSSKTQESLLSESYDHHAAIYYLLQDRALQQSLGSENLLCFDCSGSLETICSKCTRLRIKRQNFAHPWNPSSSSDSGVSSTDDSFEKHFGEKSSFRSYTDDPLESFKNDLHNSLPSTQCNLLNKYENFDGGSFVSDKKSILKRSIINLSSKVKGQSISTFTQRISVPDNFSFFPNESRSSHLRNNPYIQKSRKHFRGSSKSTAQVESIIQPIAEDDVFEEESPG